MKIIKTKRLTGILGCLLAVVLTLSLATPALAQPQPPHQFWGQVTIGGQTAPEETPVEAYVDDVKAAETTVDSEGGYGYDPLFRVPGTDGATVEFYVGSVLANEKAIWESGKMENLALTIDVPLPDTYELTMAVVGEGTATDVTNESPYEADTAVSIEAVAAGGYRFVNWTAPEGTFLDADAAETTFTMPGEAITVTATFTEVLALAAEAGGPYSGTTGASIALSGSASGGTPPYTYAWDLDGDGEYGDATGATPSHSWATAGTYTIDLEVTDSVPATAIDTATVTVTTPAPSGGGAAPTTYYTDTDLFGSEESFRISSDGKIQETIEATSADGNLTITIPQDTVALDKDGDRLASLEVAVNESPPDPPADAHIIGLAYDFGPDGATFDPAITLEYTYDPDALPEGVAEEDLVLAYYDEDAGLWVELDGVVDTVNNTITASVPHFTTFAIIGTVTPPTPPAPARFTVSSLGVSPSEVSPSEEVNISVLVANTGGEAGSYQVTLVINDLVEATKEVTVRAGLSKEVTFSVTKEDAGIYTVAVAQLSSSFTVIAPPAPAAFSVSRLSIQPAEVEAATAATIAVLVSNTGGESGSYTVVLKVNGVKEAEKTVTIAAGDSQEVSFSLTRDEPGTYTVNVDGLSGGFTVVVVTPPSGINWPLIGGIIGGVIVVGLGIFFWMRRRAY